MKVFRYGDIISSEIPSNWAELLGEPNLAPEMTTKPDPQLEFAFMEKKQSFQLRNGAEQYPEEVLRIIEVVRDVFSDSSEKLE